MDLDLFRKKRNEWIDLLNANGFADGDAEKNGEFKILETFANHFDLFADVGSNTGIFIDKINEISARENAGSLPYIMAFEPNPNHQKILESKLQNGKLIPAALSQSDGKANFNIYDSDDTTSSLFDRADMMPHFTENVTNIEVDLVKFDNFLGDIKQISNKGIFVKIDCEGAEYPVLEGAQKCFETIPNVALMFEYSSAWKNGGNTMKEAFHFLDKYGFSLFRILPLGIEKMRFYTPDMDDPGYCNYFAIKGVDLNNILERTTIRSATQHQTDLYLFNQIP